MKRKLLLAMVAVLSIVGVRQAKAYTVNDLTSAGWTKVTSLSDVDNYYYVFVDAASSDYAMGRLSYGTNKPVYMPLADPMGFAGAVWYLGEDGGNYTIKNLGDDKFFISGTAGWNDSMNENKYDDEGRFTFTLNSGKYDIKSVKTSSYVGPWNNDNKVSLSNGYEDIAANKGADQAPGFYLYAMLRTDYNAKRINASWLINHGWSEVTDNAQLGNTSNYYLIVESVTMGYALARTSNGRPASKSLSNPFVTPSLVWLTETSGSGYKLQSNFDKTYFTSAAGDWNTSMSNTPNADIIATLADGVYTLSAGGTSNIGHWRDDQFFPYENENVAANKNTTNRNSYHIYTISKTDYATQRASLISTAAAAATKDNPVNFSEFIVNNSDFAVLAKMGWNVSGSWGNQQTSNGTFETWNSNNVSVTQELTDIPSGKYKLTVQMVSGNDGRVPYLYANGSQEYTANVTQQATDASYGGMKNEITADVNYGLLTVNPYVSNGTLTVGMKAPSGWVVFDNFNLYYYGPTIEGEAIALPAGDMTADKWYYFDIAVDGDYNLTAANLGNIVYTTDGTILIEDESDVTATFASAKVNLTAGRYYVKSSSEQTFTVDADVKTYEVGDVTAQSISNGEYIKSLTTLVLTFGDAATNDGDAELEVIGGAVATLYKGGLSTGKTGTLAANDGAKTLTATFTDVDLAINSTDYHIVIPAGAFGYDGHASNSEVTVTFNTPLFADGDYYMKNKDNEAYFAGGNGWGTQAITNTIGHKVTLTALSDGKYYINTYLSNGGDNQYLNGLWCDGAATGWTFTASGDDYIISNNTGKLTAGSIGATMTLTDGTGDNTKWTLLTTAAWKAEQVARLDAAAADNGVDATFYIPAANFNRNDLDNSSWQGGPGIDGLGTGDATCNYNAQKWNTTPFDVYQELTNLKPGAYKLTAQGFYRNGTTDDRNAYLYANGFSVSLVNIKSAGVTEQDDDKGFTTENSGYYVPNKQDQAAKTFNNNYYNNELWFNVGNDGALRVGVKKSTGAAGDWTVFDKFQLTYYGLGAHVNVSAAGFATLYTDVALDFTGTGLEAYIATLSTETVTLTAVESVPANTGVVLKGTEGEYFIPTTASPAADQGSLEGSATAATAHDAFVGEGYYIYGLTQTGEGKAQFTKITSGSVAAGKAFLKVSTALTSKNLRIVDGATEVTAPEVVETEEPEVLYNMAGIPVGKDFKGYVINQKGEKRLQR